MPLRASRVGLVAGLVSAFGAVHAQQPAPAASYFAVAQSAAPVAVDPAKQVAGGLAVSSIDFKRGDVGSGKLIMRFSGDGAVPDMSNQGSDVVITVGNARKLRRESCSDRECHYVYNTVFALYL